MKKMEECKVFTTIGASNHCAEEREEHDFYATDPVAISSLIIQGQAEISRCVWEPCCGMGHLSKALKKFSHDVRSTDLIDRGYGESGVDFFQCTDTWDGDIITNPPYKMGLEFVQHALDIIPAGRKVFVFMKLTFLEGRKRRVLFDTGCLKCVYVSSGRIFCAKGGDFDVIKSSAVAYAWFEFQKGYKGDTTIKWIN